VADGDLRASLEALRDHLAVELEQAKPQYAAALAKQLSDVLMKLAGLAPVKESKIDDLAKRRAERGAKVSKRPERGEPVGTRSRRVGRQRRVGS
jgi:hypothetical protein